MRTSKSKAVNAFIIGTFVSLYLLVSIISTIHVIDFFKLSNPDWLAISLAVGFELGAAASLAALITLDKMNKTMVWALFIVITAMQMQGNMYYAYSHIKDFQGWVELFNLVEWEPIAQKRLLAAVSGAILPLVALGFIKSLVDYIKPESETDPIRVEDLDVIAEEINHPEKKSKNELEENIYDGFDELEELESTIEEFQDSIEVLENVEISTPEIELKIDELEDSIEELEDSIEELEEEIIEEIDELQSIEKSYGVVDVIKQPETTKVEEPKKMRVFNNSTHRWDEVDG
jgi:methyl-accepting chemotaxis protein